MDGPDAGFLKLALLPYRNRMLAAIRRGKWAKSEHLEVDVVGIPGVKRVACFVWPEPLGMAERLAIDVVRYDDAVLRSPVRFAYPLSESERPSGPVETVDAADENVDRLSPSTPTTTLVVAGPEGPITWTRVPPSVVREVQKLDERGMAVVALVDTARYPYTMTCRCGRRRYAKPNGVHQITLCRVCTRMERLRKRALAQYRKRRG